jgi:crotonobetainyl-CoA:carnitine CoA-transferase CaiB-like acyl-CoA transferase
VDVQEPSNHSRRLALADLTILAVEQFAAGPWATLQLADLGATVIKVEDPTVGGDVGRYVPPYAEGEDSLYFESFNRGKRSISLDLRHPHARPVLDDLVGTVDAVFCNLRGDVVDKLGLRYADLAEANPRIVCCALSGFGLTGPRRAEGAYDHTIQALTGWSQMTGEPDGPPVKSALSLVDFSSGYVVALALLAAVHAARRDGTGGDVDLSLFEIALSQLNYVGTWVASRGYEPTRRSRSGHPSLVPFGNFTTRDGWIVIAVAKQSLWRRLCAAIGQPELASDPRFADFADRERNRDELGALLDGILAGRDTAEWLPALREAGVPSAPVNDVAAALADPQVTAREAVVEVEHPLLGTVRHIASPLRLDSGRAPVALAPRRGADTRTVLAERCGYSEERIDQLVAAGVLADAPPPLTTSSAQSPARP